MRGTKNDVWTYTFGAHLGHSTEFLVALLCYYLFFSSGEWLVECKTWRADWVLRVLAYNAACELVFCGGWHGQYQ